MNKKKILNIILNIILFSILFYFVDLKKLIDSVSKMNMGFLILGICLSIFFTVIIALRWENLLNKFNGNQKRNRGSFIVASHKKEFYASFTSNVIGDIYSVLKLKGNSKRVLTYSLLITKYFDFFIVAIISIISLILLKYLNILVGILLIFSFVLFLFFINFFIQGTLNILSKINKKKKFKILSKLEILKDKKLNIKKILKLFLFTIFIWGIRLGITFITFKSLHYDILISQLLFVTFVPIIVGLVVFILPKSISGDSTTIILGTSIGLDYHILLGYVLIHRIYSIVISSIGIGLDMINKKS